MIKLLKIVVFSLFFLFSLLETSNAQNRFEGYNVFINALETQTQAAGACAVRYSAPTNVITITDLNSSTPLKVSSCSGTDSAARQLNANSATVVASQSEYKWCFTGEDKMYQISFEGDRLAGKQTYNWIATPPEVGFYNVRDFGAKGDGQTDDTTAIRSALAYVASRNGGTLRFPQGDYVIGNEPNFKGLSVPSGIIIEGVGSSPTGGQTGFYPNQSASRIRLKGNKRAIFRIGECTERVVIRDIELIADSNDETYGIEAFGAFTSSQDFFFDRITFNNFYRGIYAYMLPANNRQWQFDFIKVRDSRFLLSRDAAIWVDLWNSDWKIEGSLLLSPQKAPGVAANGIYIIRNGAVLIQDTFAGSPSGFVGGDFINITENSILTVIGSQCEKMTRSLVFGERPGAGNLSYPIALINNIFDDPIEIKAPRTLVSTGNLYGANTVRLSPNVRVYSTGDRFCYDGNIIGCATGKGPTNFIGGKIIFSTGQPAEGSVPGRPTEFGSEVKFNAPVQMPNLLFNDLPRTNVGNGSMVFCTNCRRSSSPCTTGGNGAPAMFMNGRWECL